MTYIKPTATPAWQALTVHYDKIKTLHLREMFAKDPGRGERFVAEGAGLYLDYSKNRITEETLRLLLRLAEERSVAAWRDAMFRGEKINITEGRAAFRVALRAPKGSVMRIDGHDVVPDVHAVLGHMGEFAQRVRDGTWLEHTGRPIRSISASADPRSGNGLSGITLLQRPV